jgi:hypothetical protein
MRIKLLIGAALAIAVVSWSRTSSGQVQPMPGPGTGVVTVTGSVEVAKMPGVDAAQRGDWNVSILSVPPEAPLPFLKAGVRYFVVWTVAETEIVTVAALGPRGWVRVEEPDASGRWVNLDGARSVRPAR